MAVKILKIIPSSFLLCLVLFQSALATDGRVGNESRATVQVSITIPAEVQIETTAKNVQLKLNSDISYRVVTPEFRTVKNCQNVNSCSLAKDTSTSVKVYIVEPL